MHESCEPDPTMTSYFMYISVIYPIYVTRYRFLFVQKHKIEA